MMPIASIVSAVMELALQVTKWIDEGLSTKEIQDRLSDPTGVGKDLIERIRSRHERGRSLLGRERA
jgi:hypothetical protein